MWHVLDSQKMYKSDIASFSEFLSNTGTIKLNTIDRLVQIFLCGEGLSCRMFHSTLSLHPLDAITTISSSCDMKTFLKTLSSVFWT